MEVGNACWTATNWFDSEEGVGAGSGVTRDGG